MKKFKQEKYNSFKKIKRNKQIKKLIALLKNKDHVHETLWIKIYLLRNFILLQTTNCHSIQALWKEKNINDERKYYIESHKR